MKSTKKHKAVFLDRDGTINVHKPYMWKVEDFEWILGAKEGLKKLSQTDYKIIIVSNQSVIGRGYCAREDIDALHDWMLKECEKEAIRIDAIYYCPHHPSDGCPCRKPSPEMLFRAAEEHEIDLNESWLVGDNPSDIAAGEVAGVKTIRVKSGVSGGKGKTERPHVVAEHLGEGVEHIMLW